MRERASAPWRINANIFSLCCVSSEAISKEGVRQKAKVRMEPLTDQTVQMREVLREEKRFKIGGSVFCLGDLEMTMNV